MCSGAKEPVSCSEKDRRLRCWRSIGSTRRVLMHPLLWWSGNFSCAQHTASIVFPRNRKRANRARRKLRASNRSRAALSVLFRIESQSMIQHTHRVVWVLERVFWNGNSPATRLRKRSSLLNSFWRGGAARGAIAVSKCRLGSRSNNRAERVIVGRWVAMEPANPR